MTVDTVFDLASLTKPLATATSIMVLTERGQVRPRSKVAEYLPEFANHGKEDIRVKQLLIHRSGLKPFLPIERTADSADAGWQEMFESELRAEPDSEFIYSDINFMILGKIVERVSGQSLHEFSREHIYAPLGMNETGFLPSEELRLRCACTEERDGRPMRGDVHDPRAWFLGGIAGHAGLFSTADDLAIYAQMMLGGGTYCDVRVLGPSTIELMTAAYDVGRGTRGLGWDKQSPYSSNRGDLMSERAFGHGGFTGTAIWIDPELDLFVIFLSNRVHPDGNGDVNDLIGRIGNVAAGAITVPVLLQRGKREEDVDQRADASELGEVLNGIDVLERDGFKQLAGRRVGLITNHTGHNRDRVSTVDLLHRAGGVELVTIFSPEHGFRGVLDQVNIANATDESTGLPIRSLYGETRKPTPQMLHGLDTLVFDVQDIGTRFYTYISTMGLAMEAAAEYGLIFVVLDRVNPIGGHLVAGPVLDEGQESFVGFHPTPVRHGMTAGELARMFRSERGLENLDLVVVPLAGWRRDMYFDETGLPWTNPSPNMRSLTEAVLYPGIGLLETTNVSVGRGTDTPFEVIGAPWIDG
jgi:CubicO group peptidase (beta-lactamase class C family)